MPPTTGDLWALFEGAHRALLSLSIVGHGCNVHSRDECVLQMSEALTFQWLLLAASLPGRESNAARIRLWRTLKDLGAASLRDGVTLVPMSAANRERLAEIEAQIEEEGGAAWTFAVPPQAPATEKRLKALFDRTQAYGEIAPAVAALRKDLAALDEASARRRFRQSERDFQSIADLDFFPGTPRTRFRESLDKLRSSIDRRFSPREPSSVSGGVPQLALREFRNARWATRKRLWVDRVASAWLIRRCIDPRARFEWLDRPEDCPKDAHGFDFDGATFTHIDDLVTFEVLLAAFDLGGDPGLGGLGRLVHYLDVGGEGVPEASGFEAVLAGLRATCANDDALLAAVTPVLDALYEHFLHAH
jgi:hypothetical protein